MSHSQQTPNKPRDSAKSRSRGFTVRWFFSVDDLVDADSTALEIDSPDFYLTFELADKPQIRKALTLLESIKTADGGVGPCKGLKAPGKFRASAHELVLGHFGHANVFLIKDVEECHRFYIVVGGKSKFKVRVSLEGERIRALAAALRAVTADE
jgi:hypothetical protein